MKDINIPVLNLRVWSDKWMPRDKLALIGGILGALAWVFSVDFAIAITMIPLVIAIGIVILPLAVGAILTTLGGALIGMVAGYSVEKLHGWKQGLAVASISLAVIVGAFAYMYVPPDGLLTGPGPEPTYRMMRADQYRRMPFETLASVAGSLSTPHPGYMYLRYPAGYQYQQPTTPTRTDCNFGVSPTGECNPLPRETGYILDH